MPETPMPETPAVVATETLDLNALTEFLSEQKQNLWTLGHDPETVSVVIEDDTGPYVRYVKPVFTLEIRQSTAGDYVRLVVAPAADGDDDA